MQVLTEKGEMEIAEIADRHGVSSAAAGQLLSAIAAGGGRQAQFDHPELGGMGQWSGGGMIMIGDMFNHGLKARVAALCSELAQVWRDSSSAMSEDMEPPSSDARSAPLSTNRSSQRWPAEWGAPAATGSQNEMHYAVFPDARRLAIDRDGEITVYDTQDHRIGGVSQQQGADRDLRFTSQSGAVALSDLAVVGPAARAGQTPAANRASGKGDDEIFSRLERLADLRDRAIITAAEFDAKKAELLARL